MAILSFEQRHDLGKAPLFCQSKIYSALYVILIPPPPIYLLHFKGGQNTEVSQYIEEDIIQLIMYDKI